MWTVPVEGDMRTDWVGKNGLTDGFHRKELL